MIIKVIVYGQIDIFSDCKSGPLASFPICDQLLPARQRATHLVSWMTIDEKASCLVHALTTIPQLGLPSYLWLN